MLSDGNIPLLPKCRHNRTRTLDSIATVLRALTGAPYLHKLRRNFSMHFSNTTIIATSLFARAAAVPPQARSWAPGDNSFSSSYKVCPWDDKPTKDCVLTTKGLPRYSTCKSKADKTRYNGHITIAPGTMCRFFKYCGCVGGTQTHYAGTYPFHDGVSFSAFSYQCMTIIDWDAAIANKSTTDYGAAVWPGIDAGEGKL